jgi:hypothetical protein
MANVAAGALVFAQFLGESAYSPWLAGRRHSAVGLSRRLRGGSARKDRFMIGIYILFGGIALFAGVITLLDGIASSPPRRA